MDGFNYPTAQEIVAEYLRQLDSGTPVTEEDVISTHRQLEDELRAEFRKLNLIKIAVTQSDEVEHIVTSTSASVDGIDADTVTTRPHPLPTTVLRCPNCNEPMDAMLEGSFRAVECEACGKQFSLVRERQWPKQIAHFELLERIGMGGFGSVWKARDRELDRLVALKLPRRAFVEESDADQFLHEAQTAARLNHPNIVRVHEVGVFEGSIYIASELIDGKPLSQHIGHGLTEKEAVRLAEPIARALHYAHECGVVHRDLKPQNVILGSDGKPYLSDFGLARSGDTDLSLTVSGQILGTPGYMSPEQARGESRNADARSDIYSLGILLYELLTAQVPFQGTPETVFLRVQQEDPVNPRKLNHSVSVDVDTICMKCLEKDPDRRYQTALEVAEELERVATGNPIFARPVGIAERSFRWAKRNPTVAVLTVGLLVAFLIVSLLGSFSLAQGRISENRKRDSLMTQIRELRVASRYGYRDEVERILADHPELIRDERLRGPLRDEIVLCMGDFAAQQARQVDYEEVMVTSAAISSNGAKVAIGLAESGEQNFCMEIRDVNLLNKGAHRLKFDERIAALQFPENSPGIITALGSRGTLTRISVGPKPSILASTTVIPSPWAEAEDGSLIEGSSFSPCGKFVGFTDGKTVCLWDIEQGGLDFRRNDFLPDDKSKVRCVAVSRGAEYVVVGYSDDLGSVCGVVRWSRNLPAAEQKKSKQLNRGTLYPNSIAISDDGKTLAVGCEQTILFEMDALEDRQFIQNTEVHALAFRPNSSHLAVDDISNTIEIWNYKTNSLVAEVRQTGRTGNDGAAFSQDGTRFLAWDIEGIRIFNLDSHTERVTIDVHERGVPTLAFTADGLKLVSGSKDGTVKFWNADFGTRSKTSASINGLGQIQCLALHPKKPWIAVAHWSAVGDSLLIYRTSSENDEPLLDIPNDLGLICGLGFSKDGSYIAASGDYGVRVWHLKDVAGTLVATLKHRAVRTNNESGTSNEKLVKSNDKFLAFDQSGLTLFHAEEWGDRIRTIDLRTTPMKSDDLDSRRKMDMLIGWHGLDFTLDNRLVFVSPDKALEVWNIDDMSSGGHLLRKTEANKFSDSQVAVSKDGFLAGLSDARTVSIWDIDSGELRYTFRPERGSIWSFAWSPDGKKLAVGLSNGGLSIWDLQKVEDQLQRLGF